jgi:hypothetical protein
LAAGLTRNRRDLAALVAIPVSVFGSPFASADLCRPARQ